MKRRLRRRIVTAGAGLALLAGVRPAFAQTLPKLPRLGMLFHEPLTAEELLAHPTIARLAELGWVENRTLIIDRALSQADPTRVPALVERLIRDGAHVLWVDDFDPAVAAARATKTIPIIFCGIALPLEQGLIDSYARPGRNVTGVANSIGTGVSSRRLTLLKAVAPKARRLGWVISAEVVTTASGSSIDVSAWEADARKAGFDPVIYLVSSVKDLEAAFKQMIERRTEAISVGGGAVTGRYRERMVRFANENRLPSAYFLPEFVDAGGLLSFGTDELYTKRTAAEYIDRVLRGDNPANMPVEQPKKFITVINLRTAKLLGLTIPQSVLVQVDRLIQQ